MDSGVVHGVAQMISVGLQIPDEFRCCICLCATSKALMMSCSHRVCTCCAEQAQLKACPVCCQALPEGGHEDVEFSKRALNTHLTCGCGAEVLLLEADQHNCERTLVPASTMSISRKDGQTQVNRSTFTCPLCGEANLSRQGLLDHCKQHHTASKPACAVCPICASMPWGDPSYASQDFVSHLQTRHKCDYDVLTDYNATEEESVRRALQASVNDTEDDMLAQILRASAEEAHSIFGQSEDELMALAMAESMKELIVEKS